MVCMNIALSTTGVAQFPTHEFTYILPGIIYHPDVENPVNRDRSGIARCHVPCTEPIMITAILGHIS